MLKSTPFFQEVPPHTPIAFELSKVSVKSLYLCLHTGNLFLYNFFFSSTGIFSHIFSETTRARIFKFSSEIGYESCNSHDVQNYAN